jgi:hypothetical protein
MSLTRKIYILAILTILLLVIMCFNTRNVSGAKIYPDHINSLYTLSLWLYQFDYQDDPEGYWKSPIETINDKGGDCEDSAILVRYIIEDLKLTDETSLVVMFSDKSGHAFNIVQNERGYAMFSNFRYYAVSFNSMLEVVNWWYPGWKKLYYIDHDNQLHYIGKTNEIVKK